MIQLFKPVYRVDDVLEALRPILEQGWTGIGGNCYKFEEKFKEYTGLPHAHFLNSATSGLQLALRLIKYRERIYNIATSPLTFIATNHSILNEGATPRFVDVDDSLNMDPTKLEILLRAGVHQAVIFTGIGGNPQNLKEVSQICLKYNTPLILDASHMLGTWLDNRDHVGKEADFTVFSTQAVKNLSTGDGGFICCKNKEEDKLARKLSWLGISKETSTREGWDYEVNYLGNKWHGNALAATVGLVGLRYLSLDNFQRRAIASRYLTDLSTKCKIVTHKGCSARHLFQVRVSSEIRDEIIKLARERDVQLGVHYRTNTDYLLYEKMGTGMCPLANQFSREIISLPMGTHLSDDDVKKVIEVMNECIDLVKEYPAF